MDIRKRFVLFFFCLITLLLATSMPLSQPIVLAARGRLIISGQTSGHSGTTFRLDGLGVTPDGTYNLYATLDATKCTTGDPDTLGLQAFTPATVPVHAGIVSQGLTWPTTINQTGIYYLCLANAADLAGVKTVSINTFTLTATATLDISPDSVMPGQSITLNGYNWLPAQTLDVAVIADGNDAPVLVENNNVLPDATGSFQITLVIPEKAAPGNYTIRASAVKDQTLTVVKKDGLTVTPQVTPTPTPTVQPSPTPTPIPTVQPSPTPTPTSAVVAPTNPSGPGAPQNTDTGNINLLIFGMAGLGVLFILIGAVIFAVSMQMENE